ncbi:MAG: EAL domain-containing protein [Gammaproteobacteria bacterium]|nr:EAL domain-containing protein [Gammaproteobacteria bacterium]
MSDTNNKKNNVSDLRENLQHREAEIDLLQRTFTEIGSELDLDNLFQLIAERARELVKAETLLIPVLDVNCETYTYRASAGVNSDEIVGEALPLDFGVCGWVWRHKKAWWRGVLGDLSEDERNRWEKEAGSLILVPLQGKNHFLGGISAINKVGHHEFTRRDFNLLNMFAGIVSVAIENAMVVQQMEQTSRMNEDYRRRLKIMNKQLLESNRELEFHALYDPLTSLPNRSLFRDRLSHGIARAESAHAKLGLLLIDLDRFKDINDALGHDKGDYLLKEIALLLQQYIHPDDTFARLGGDEFAVILPDCDRKSILERANAFLKALEKPFIINDSTITVGASIGITVYPEHGDNVTDMLCRADSAMYSAKKLKQGIMFYEPASDYSPLGYLTMVTDLRNAMENNEFELYYQPQIDIKTNQIIAVEALGRWVHPRYGVVKPDVFISELEQIGLIEKYTSWGIETALRDAVAWRSSGYDLKVSVNISVNDLLNPDFMRRLDLIVGLHEDGELLTFEITENLFLSEYDRLFEVLEYIRYLGISLSIDDFGTGYSSLSRLKKLPVSELKIDQSFVKDMEQSPNDEVIVHSTIELAHNLGLSVVAEGVQSAATLQRLASLGCDTAQGFVISEPVSADEFAALMASSQAKAG